MLLLWLKIRCQQERRSSSAVCGVGLCIITLVAVFLSFSLVKPVNIEMYGAFILRLI